MKQEIRHFIERFVSDYQDREDIATRYGLPLVGFADAHHPYIQSLPDLIAPTHELPLSYCSACLIDSRFSSMIPM